MIIVNKVKRSLRTDSDATISLYRNNDGAGANGTLIVAGLSEDADGPAGSYVWDLAGFPAGTWYVYGVIIDANTTGTDYAPGTVTIGAPAAQASNLAWNKTASASSTRNNSSYYGVAELEVYQ